MSFFASTDQLYACTRLLFERLQEQDPTAADTFLAARLLIRFRCRQPAAEITLNGRRRPLETIFGSTTLRPDVEVELAADTLHQIMLGQLSLKKAVGNGQLKARGPLYKTLALTDLFYRGQALYPQVLREQGIGA
ncbi:MAG: SCP2 sterol-binding domain-containing protein [Chloroflexota bacterium]